MSADAARPAADTFIGTPIPDLRPRRAPGSGVAWSWWIQANGEADSNLAVSEANRAIFETV